jgi:colicin import membrane protein
MKNRNFSHWILSASLLLSINGFSQQSATQRNADRYNNYDHITQMSPGKQVETIHTFYRDKEYKFTFINNELTELYVDEVKINPAQYKKYEDVIKGIREQIAIDRKQAARDQAQAKLDQQEAARDQEQARSDQRQAQQDQQQAKEDQQQARKDQEQAAKDQVQAKADQRQALEDQEQARADQKMMNDMIADLINDGIVLNEKSILSITLSETEMTVNDKKQPEAVLNRYKEKYSKWAAHHFSYGGNHQYFQGIHMSLRDN